jgi:hypothetical protein
VLECRIPISPTSSFLNRTVLLAKSIRRWYPDARVVAYIGSECSHDALRRFVYPDLTLEGIDVVLVDREVFLFWAGSRSPYLATMNARFHKTTQADHILIMDADVLCTARFDELFETDAVQGMQAHMPPYGDADMFRLFVAMGLKPPVFNQLYSGAGIMCGPNTRGPAYFNSGMIFAPASQFNALCEPYHEAIEVLRRTVNDTYWFDQLAVMLALAKVGEGWDSLPQRFNFPNQREFDVAFPDELKDVRFLHYLRTDTVDRDREFVSDEAMDAFVARRDLTGSNEVLRRTVDRLRQPAELSRVEDAPWA